METGIRSVLEAGARCTPEAESRVAVEMRRQESPFTGAALRAGLPKEPGVTGRFPIGGVVLIRDRQSAEFAILLREARESA